MDTLQRLFNRLVGVDLRPASHPALPPAAAQRLPHAIEKPACWRRAAKVRLAAGRGGGR